MNTEWAEALRHRMHDGADSLGNLLVEGFHYLALFAIGGVTAWAAIAEFLLILNSLLEMYTGK